MEENLEKTNNENLEIEITEPSLQITEEKVEAPKPTPAAKPQTFSAPKFNNIQPNANYSQNSQASVNGPAQNYHQNIPAQPNYFNYAQPNYNNQPTYVPQPVVMPYAPQATVRQKQPSKRIPLLIVSLLSAFFAFMLFAATIAFMAPSFEQQAGLIFLSFLATATFTYAPMVIFALTCLICSAFAIRSSSVAVKIFSILLVIMMLGFFVAAVALPVLVYFNAAQAGAAAM